jgi:hypothetical protein
MVYRSGNKLMIVWASLYDIGHFSDHESTQNHEEVFPITNLRPSGGYFYTCLEETRRKDKRTVSGKHQRPSAFDVVRP